MSFLTHTTGDVDDAAFGRQLAVIGLVWLSLFVVATWLLVTYGHVATDLLF
ncbi:hypothetical protein [Haloparvum sp. AD34]